MNPKLLIIPLITFVGKAHFERLRNQDRSGAEALTGHGIIDSPLIIHSAGSLFIEFLTMLFIPTVPTVFSRPSISILCRYSRLNHLTSFHSRYSTKMSQPDITLYTCQTPNGIKISIALEELGYVCNLMPPLF